MLPTITFLVIFFWEVVASPFLPSLHFQYKRMVKMLTYRKKIYWDVNHWLFGYTKKVLKVPFFWVFKNIVLDFYSISKVAREWEIFFKFFLQVAHIVLYVFITLLLMASKSIYQEQLEWLRCSSLSVRRLYFLPKIHAIYLKY